MKPKRLQKIREDIMYLQDQSWWLGKGRMLRMLTDMLDEIDRLQAENDALRKGRVATRGSSHEPRP